MRTSHIQIQIQLKLWAATRCQIKYISRLHLFQGLSWQDVLVTSAINLTDLQVQKNINFVTLKLMLTKWFNCARNMMWIDFLIVSLLVNTYYNNLDEKTILDLSSNGQCWTHLLLNAEIYWWPDYIDTCKTLWDT